MELGSIADWFAGGATAAAVIVALGGYRFAEWQRSRDRRDAERTAGRQIGIKLFRVMNGTDDIRRHLWAPYEGPLVGSIGADQLWRTIQPLSGLEIEPGLALNAAECDLLVKINATDFMMRQMLATSRYENIVRGMQEYRVRYEAIYQMLPPPTAMEGQIVQHNLTMEQILRIRPYSLVLDTLLQSLRTMSAENVADCGKLAEEFNPLMKGYFKEKFMALKKPDGRG
jgi:hypothetical protein